MFIKNTILLLDIIIEGSLYLFIVNYFTGME